MNELTMDRLKENLESLKMKNTLEILDNYLERAVAEKLNVVDVLDHIFAEEAKSKRRRAYEKQIQMSGFPIKKTLDDFDFSFQPSIDKRQIDELATMRFLENGENVVFLGPPGVGKTQIMEQVETDLTTADLLAMVELFKDVDLETAFVTESLAGHSQTISGGSYWIVDEEALPETVQRVFYAEPPQEEVEGETETQNEEGGSLKQLEG